MYSNIFLVKVMNVMGNAIGATNDNTFDLALLTVSEVYELFLPTQNIFDSTFKVIYLSLLSVIGILATLIIIKLTVILILEKTGLIESVADNDIGVRKKDTDFLKGYSELNLVYNRVIDLVTRINKSSVATKHEFHVKNLMDAANKTVSTLKSMSELTTPSLSSVVKAQEKLEKIEKALKEILDSEANLLSVVFDEIQIPETYKVQLQIEELKNKGEVLLRKLDRNPTLINSEDRLRLQVIVNKRLDEVLVQYLHANIDNEDEYHAVAATKNGSKAVSPDIIVKGILSDVEDIFDSVSKGQKVRVDTEVLTNLLATKRYFEKR